MMTSSKKLALAFTLLVATATAANAQLTPLQQRLIQDTLPSGMASDIMRSSGALAAPGAFAMPGQKIVSTELRRTDHWGFRFANVPQLLSQHVDAVADGRGLVINHVFAKSPAAVAGLKEGQILLGTENTVFYKSKDVPNLTELTEVVILDQGQQRRVSICPLPGQLGVFRPMLPSPPINDAMFRPAVPGFLYQPPISGSVAVTGNNGLFNIKAATPETNVELKGTKSEINEQLKKVPTRTRTLIQQQLNNVE